MKIAQLAPLWEPVPPKTYGGTELVVYNLVQELSKAGHEITLFASGDSIIPDSVNVELVPMEPVSLREQDMDLNCDYSKYSETHMMAEVLRRSGEFDVIHNHLGFQFLPLAHLSHAPIVTTIHGALVRERDEKFLSKYAGQPLVSISEYQQIPVPYLNYVANIYHGIELERIPAKLETSANSYLAFLGRLSPEKGPLEAIQVAKATGRKLLMAGKINSHEKKFFDNEIAPHIDGEQIQYIGELNHEEKVEFLGNAAATICPLKWPEPFGLVLAESMACGTPVFAFANGSVPEIVEHKVSGYIGNTTDDLIQAVKELDTFDRSVVRQYAETHFSRQRMAQDYIKMYESLVESKRHLKAAKKPKIYSVVTSYAAGGHLAVEAKPKLKSAIIPSYH